MASIWIDSAILMQYRRCICKSKGQSCVHNTLQMFGIWQYTTTVICYITAVNAYCVVSCPKDHSRFSCWLECVTSVWWFIDRVQFTSVSHLCISSDELHTSLTFLGVYVEFIKVLSPYKHWILYSFGDIKLGVVLNFQ